LALHGSRFEPLKILYFDFQANSDLAFRRFEMIFYFRDSNNKQIKTFTSARTLLGILRLSTALARLRLVNQVCNNG
jgi:hypothetical protein